MRQKKMYGGGRNTVPKPGTDLPEITNANDLKNYMKFYNILGHGVMSEEKQSVFILPENTWILFITRAGIAADKRKSGDLGEALNDFYFLKEGESEQQWYERIYKGMEDGTLFRAILYRNKPNENFSIYEPGDVIQDLELQFTNDHWPFMRLGIWDCPMPFDVKQRLDTINDMNDIIRYNPDIKALFKLIQDYKNDYPAYTQGINKIVAFLQDYANVTYENYLKFEADRDVQEAFANKILRKLYLDFLQAVQLFKQKNIQDQYDFFKHANNLVVRSPSVAEGKWNSSLYNLLTENKLAYSGTSTINEPLLNTAKYKFIVVDACRSIEDPSMNEALYRGRAALTRSMSVSARTEVCYTNLLQMTKRRFQEIVQGQTISHDSAIMKLLEGQRVLLDEFEASVTGSPGSLRTFLEHQQFKTDDIVYVKPPGTSSGFNGVISGIGINASGKLLYKVINASSGETVNVPASSVYGKKSNITLISLLRGIENLDAKAVRNREAAEQKRAEEEAARREQQRLAAEAAAQEAQRQRNIELREAEAAAEATAKLKFTAEVAAQDSKIKNLPEDKKQLIKYRKKIWINKPDDPTFNNRYGYIVGVGAKKNTGELLFAVELQRFGADPENFPRKKAFPPSVLQEGLNPTNAAKSKKGGRMTKRSKKSKQRKTRRH